jgi:hypothetical protein
MKTFLAEHNKEGFIQGETDRGQSSAIRPPYNTPPVDGGTSYNFQREAEVELLAVRGNIAAISVFRNRIGSTATKSKRRAFSLLANIFVEHNIKQNMTKIPLTALIALSSIGFAVPATYAGSGFGTGIGIGIGLGIVNKVLSSHPQPQQRQQRVVVHEKTRTVVVHEKAAPSSTTVINRTIVVAPTPAAPANVTVINNQAPPVLINNNPAPATAAPATIAPGPVAKPISATAKIGAVTIPND